MATELDVTHFATWLEVTRPASEAWPGSTRDDAFTVLPENVTLSDGTLLEVAQPLVLPDVPAPKFWVLTGKPQGQPDSLPLRQLLDFADLHTRTADEHLKLRDYGEQHGLLGTRQITTEMPSGEDVTGEPISAWVEASKDVASAIHDLRVCGAFEIDPEGHEPEAWEWLVSEGTLKGPRDKAALLAAVRDRINARLREHHAPVELRGDRLPLRFTLTTDTHLAALWRKVAECACGQSRIRFCEVCHAPLTYSGTLARPGRRADARTCSVNCRVKKLRKAREDAGLSTRGRKKQESSTR